jgi:hypothetical protein
MKNVILVSLLSLCTAGVSVPVLAEQAEGQNTIKADDVKDQKNKVPGESADDLLTNAKLRAETGSTSRWSIATSLAYNGGTVARPFADYRPNIQDVNGDSPVSDVEGGVNVKYNISQRDSLLLGETVRYITPLSSIKKTPQGYRGDKVDSYNPSLTYQHIYKAGPFQSYYQVGPTVVTQTDYTKIGYLGNFSLYNVNAYDVGQTPFTVGLESTATYGWYRSPRAYTFPDDPTSDLTIDQTRAAYTDYLLQFFPYLEYKISDSLNLRTVCMWFSVEHTLANQAFWTWHKDKAMQSVGLGISLTRDIFLYPNVQFIPDQLRSKQTNVALSTNINIF